MHATKATESFQTLAESVIIDAETLTPVPGRINLWRVDHHANPEYLETPAVKEFLDGFVATANREIVQRARERGERVWITGLELFWNAGSSFGPTKGQFVAAAILPAPVLPRQQLWNKSMSAQQNEAVGAGGKSLDQHPYRTANQDQTIPPQTDPAPTDEIRMAVGEQETETSTLKGSHRPAAEEQKDLTLTLQEKPEILFRTLNDGRLCLDPTTFGVGDILEMLEYERPEAKSGG